MMKPAESHVTCTRRLEFDAAHRVMEHESKCKNLHGHRYVLEATFHSQALDSIGRTIDFGTIKQILGEWIDKNWDHATILNEADKALGASIAAHTHQSIFYLPYNPTAENMATYLLEIVIPSLFNNFSAICTKVKIWETPNCSAEATAGNA